jgi:hypothetical protein
MLGLMASILQWSDQERERAGLQRSVINAGNGARGKGRIMEEKIEESEVGHYPSSVLQLAWAKTELRHSHSPKCGLNFFSKRRHKAVLDFQPLHILRVAFHLQLLCHPYLPLLPPRAPAVVRQRKVGLGFPRWR